MNRNTQKSHLPWKLWIIPVLFVVLVSLLVLSNKNTFLERIGLQYIDNTVDGFVVGEEVMFSGFLSSSNNLRYYTMVLTTPFDGIFGLKSTVLDLSSYRGREVIVRGTIVDVINNVPVMNVISLVTGDDVVIEETEAQYIVTAGLILNPPSLENYSVVSVDSSSIVFATPGGEEVDLTYFDCTNDQGITDCKYLLGQFADAESRFTGTDGDEWVQLPETNAWIGSNDDRIGYRVAEVDQIVLTDIMNGVTFVNDRYVSRYLTTPAKEACQTLDYMMTYVSDTLISYDADEVVTLTLEGTDTEANEITCMVDVDPRTMKAELVSIDGDVIVSEDDNDGYSDDSIADVVEGVTGDENLVVDQDNDIEVVTDDVVNTDPAPLLTTPLPFTSSRGYTIVFPSSNIAFQGLNNDESLGIDGVAGCWTQMNVVHFDSAEYVLDNPAVVMYDCIDVDDEIGPLNTYIRRDGTESGKIFFIKVLNEEWREFAEAIVVE